MRMLLWSLSRTTRSCTTRLVNISRTMQGMSFYRSSLPRVASCLSRCERSGLMDGQTWIQDKLGFTLRSHIRCKGFSKSSAFKLQARGASASATTAHDISRASTDTDSMEISMRSTGTMLEPQQVARLTESLWCSSVNYQVMDQFTQMRTMLSSFLGKKQDTTTRTAFCKYMASEVEEKDFQTFRN